MNALNNIGVLNFIFEKTLLDTNRFTQLWEQRMIGTSHFHQYWSSGQSSSKQTWALTRPRSNGLNRHLWNIPHRNFRIYDILWRNSRYCHCCCPQNNQEKPVLKSPLLWNNTSKPSSPTVCFYKTTYFYSAITQTLQGSQRSHSSVDYL